MEDCEWMKHPGPLKDGSNWCPNHPPAVDGSRHGWYHYTPEEHEEVCEQIRRNRMLDQMKKKKENSNVSTSIENKEGNQSQDSGREESKKDPS